VCFEHSGNGGPGKIPAVAGKAGIAHGKDGGGIHLERL
jgi:hypothetical protein